MTTTTTGFTKAEIAAMKAHARELKAEGKAGAKKAEGLETCLAKIAEMSEPDRSIAERLHAIVTTAAPDLDAKTWYGMPAYARDGKVVCSSSPRRSSACATRSSVSRTPLGSTTAPCGRRFSH